MCKEDPSTTFGMVDRIREMGIAIPFPGHKYIWYFLYPGKGDKLTKCGYSLLFLYLFFKGMGIKSGERLILFYFYLILKLPYF